MPLNTVPVVNPDGMWQTWNKKDIYTGPTGAGQYVPKVGDMVVEIISGSVTNYEVVSVDPVSYLSQLRALNADTGGEFNINPLFGVGPGTEADTYICYIDRSVNPHRLTVDQRCSCAGSMTRYAKIFLGTDASAETGEVISAVYNASGVYQGENVELEKVGTWRNIELLENVAIWVPKPCHTHANLADGEVVTAWFYDEAGFVVSKRQLLVVNSAFVRGLNAASREVIEISLESPFLGAANSDTIYYPVNIPVVGMNLVGVVSYSNGEVERYAVNGTPFSIEGLEAYAPTIVGQKVPLILKYELQPGESAYGVAAQNRNHVSREYKLVTQPVSGTYDLRLFPIPTWVDAASGYAIKWMIYDLNRSIARDVTNYVMTDTAHAVYRPTQYGAKQTLRVYINMQDLDAIYANFFHVQFVDIVLNNPETTRPPIGGVPNWEIASPAGTVPTYGQGVYAKFTPTSAFSNQLSLKGDYDEYEDWLEAYYTNANPLFNPVSETASVTPTHFAISYNGFEAEYPINQWDQLFIINTAMTNNDTLVLKFFRRTTGADLQLVASPVGLRQINSIGNYI